MIYATTQPLTKVNKVLHTLICTTVLAATTGGCTNVIPGTRNFNDVEVKAATTVYNNWQEVYKYTLPESCWDGLKETKVAVVGESDFRNACKVKGPEAKQGVSASACYLWSRCWGRLTNAIPRSLCNWYSLIVIHESVVDDAYMRSFIHEFIHRTEGCMVDVGYDYAHEDPLRWHDAGDTPEIRKNSVEGRTRSDLGL